MPKIPTVIGDPDTGWSEWDDVTEGGKKNGKLFIYCCECLLCHEWQIRISNDGRLNPEYRIRVDRRKTSAARRESRKKKKR